MQHPPSNSLLNNVLAKRRSFVTTVRVSISKDKTKSKKGGVCLDSLQAGRSSTSYILAKASSASLEISMVLGLSWASLGSSSTAPVSPSSSPSATSVSAGPDGLGTAG